MICGIVDVSGRSSRYNISMYFFDINFFQDRISLFEICLYLFGNSIKLLSFRNLKQQFVFLTEL